MTVSSTTARQTYIGDGSLATYPYNFRIFSGDDLVLIKRNTSTGAETPMVYNVDYTVTGAESYSGGTFTLTAGVLPVGYTVAAYRLLDLLQSTDLRNQGSFLAETIERVFDRLLMIDQQQQDQLNRALVIPASEPSALMLPTKELRANKALVFDVNGDPTAGAAPSSGTISAPMQPVTSAATLAAARAAFGVNRSAGINVKDYPYLAAGDGVTNDSAAIQAAVDACIAAGGGSILIPPGKYMLGSTIDIAADTQPVWLIGLGGATSGYQLSDEGCYIAPLNALPNGMIRFRSPTGALSRARCGSGGVVGLTFLDPTAAGNAQPGTRSIKAALSLEDFNFGVVRDCHFRNLLGCGIRAEFMVMGDIDRCTFRYCGDTSKPALHLGAGPSGTSVQSTAVRSCRLEVNWTATYLKMDQYCGDCKVIACGFESEDTGGIYVATQQRYIESLGGKNIISGCHFNRNTKANVYTNSTAGRNVVNGCRTSTSTIAAQTEARFIIADNNNVIGDISADYGFAEDLLFNVTGFYNTLSNISSLNAGGIALAAWNTLQGFFSQACAKASGFVVTAADFCLVQGCIIRNPLTAAVGGIQTSGNFARIKDNVVTGCGVGSTAFDLQGAPFVEANIQSGNSGTAYALGASARVERNEGIMDGSVVWNPGTVAAGSAGIVTTTLAVTGCHRGDNVRVRSTFSNSSLIVTGYINADGTVTIQLFNPTAAGIAPGSMTYVVSVTR